MKVGGGKGMREECRRVKKRRCIVAENITWVGSCGITSIIFFLLLLLVPAAVRDEQRRGIHHNQY